MDKPPYYHKGETVKIKYGFEAIIKPTSNQIHHATAESPFIMVSYNCVMKYEYKRSSEACLRSELQVNKW